MAILAISHIMKSTNHKYQNGRFKFFRHSHLWWL